MRSTARLSVFLISLLAGQALAASLTMPVNFDLIYLDEQRTRLHAGKRTISMDEGQHRLLLRYSEITGKKDDKVKVTSQPWIVYINVSEDTELTLRGEKHKKERLAEKYAEDPLFELIDQNGNAFPFERVMLPPKYGFQLGRDYLKEMADFELTRTNQQPPEQQSPAPAANDELSKLKAWYVKATPADQTAFRIWLVDNKMGSKQESEALQQLKHWHQQADEATRKAFQIWLIQ